LQERLDEQELVAASAKKQAVIDETSKLHEAYSQQLMTQKVEYDRVVRELAQTKFKLEEQKLASQQELADSN
jgi:hypothetical protein